MKINKQILIIISFALLAGKASPSAKSQKKTTAEQSPIWPSTMTSIDQVLQNSKYISKQGRPIPLVQLGPSSNKANAKNLRHFYIQAGVHGNEGLTVVFVDWLAKRIKNGLSPLNRINKGAAVFDLVLGANPDGLALGHRSNSAGVNLNRNFSKLWGLSSENPGSSSLSEPESAAISAFLSHKTYTAAVDVHGFIPWVVIPSPLESPLGLSKFKAKYESLKSITTQAMAHLPESYVLKTSYGLGDGGAFEDEGFWKYGIPSLCLEMAEDINKQFKVQRESQFKSYENFIFEVFNRFSESSDRT